MVPGEKSAGQDQDHAGSVGRERDMPELDLDFAERVSRVALRIAGHKVHTVQARAVSRDQAHAEQASGVGYGWRWDRDDGVNVRDAIVAEDIKRTDFGAPQRVRC